MARPAKRDQLVETAMALFYREGIHATGVDRILDKAGVARMTLYNNFSGKEELVLAALNRRSDEFRGWFAGEIARRAATPRARLLAAFAVLDDWIRGEAAGAGFAGCAFIKAASEFGDENDPVRRLAAQHKAALRTDLASLAADLLQLIDGAIVTAQVSGDAGAAARAGKMARRLLAEALPPTPE